MGIRDQLKIFRRGRSRESTRRKSMFNLVAPNQVTENSLQVWRGLPAQIRQDPSLASFQMENERLHGTTPNGEQCSISDEIESTLEDSNEGSEFINMKIFKPKADGEKCSFDPKSSDCEDPHSIDHPSNTPNNTKQHIQAYAKDIFLLVVWIGVTLTLICTDEQHLLKKRLIVPENEDRLYFLPQNPAGNFRLTLLGAFTERKNFTTDFLTVQLQVVRRLSWNDTEVAEDFMEPWIVSTVSDGELENAKIHSKNRTFILPPGLIAELEDETEVRIRLKMFTNGSLSGFPMQIVYDPLIVNVTKGVALAAAILFIFYVMLVSEVLHKAFTAMICSTMAIAVLAILGDRPTMEEVLVWMDMEMLTLIFAMMILVAFLTETGVFDYLAVLTFEISGGKIWPLIYSLCIITCLVSSVLDNMTTVLLMTPVAVRLCEVMELDPVPVILGIIAHSNMGGALTPIGDPISIIICSNHFIAKNGVTFFNFVAHTLPGVIFTVIQSCLYMRLIFWDVKTLRLNEPKALKDLRREIKVWQRAAYSLSSYSKDVDLVRETLLKKVKILKQKLRKKEGGLDSTDAYKHTLGELKAAYPIKQKKLLVLSSITMLFVIGMFFVQSIPNLTTLPLGWVALLGVALLMITANRDDMDAMMTRIEWSTLLFFAAMFIIMECVERLGLFTWIGTQTENIILFVAKENRLATAIFFILWISALASAILDSIPVAAMMVKVVVSLVAKESLGLPLQPLVWALVFGTCLGGNGTLYGSSANVLSAGIAEQHGYKVSFTRYLKVVFPMMIGQVSVITVYLMVAHIMYEWH